MLKLKRYGNDYARKVWLANAPEAGVGGRPKEGSDISVFKRFVVEVYENKKYYQEPVEEEKEVVVTAQSVGATATPIKPASAMSSNYGRQSQFQQSQQQQLRKPANAALVNGYTQPQNWGKLQRPSSSSVATSTAASQQNVAPPPVAPAAAPAPAVDLLDFGAFDSTPSQPPPPPQQQQQQPPTAAFDLFNTASPTSPTPISTTTNNDPFPTEPAVASPNTNMANGFDPFGVSVMTPSLPPATNNGATTINSNGVGAPPKQPVMNNNTSSSSQPVMNNGGNNSSFGMMNGGNMMGNVIDNMMGNNMNGGNMNGNINNGRMMMMGMNNGMKNMMMGNMNNGMNSTNNNMMMGTMNNGMNGMMMQQSQQQQPAMAMNINVMQPMNNSISNNFGSGSAGAVVNSGTATRNSGEKGNQKSDPFAGLGF